MRCTPEVGGLAASLLDGIEDRWSANCAGVGMPRAQTSRRRILILAIAAITCAVAVGLLPPMIQDPHYHSFAARRTVWGIPNFANVASNLAFLLAAALGAWKLRLELPHMTEWQARANITLLASVALVAVGSGYYHLQPDNDTLVWDRVPMTIAFMCLFAIVISRYVDESVGKRLHVPLMLLGLGSILYWQATGDLRMYVLVQFGPVVLIPLILWLFPSPANLWPTLAWYAAAKILEMFDDEIATVWTSGGHPLKHVAAALAVHCYIRTLRCSDVRTDTATSSACFSEYYSGPRSVRSSG